MASHQATQPMPTQIVWAMCPLGCSSRRRGTTHCHDCPYLELGITPARTSIQNGSVGPNEPGQITGIISRRPRPGVGLGGRRKRVLGKSTTVVWMIAWIMFMDLNVPRPLGVEGVAWEGVVNFPLYRKKTTPKPPEVTVVINNGVTGHGQPGPGVDFINQQFELLREDNLRLERFLRQDRSQPVPMASPQPRVRRRASERAREPSSRYFCYDVDDQHDDIEMFSLTNITTCQPRADQFSSPENVEIMVLNLNHKSKVTAHSCRLATTKRVHFCDDYFFRSYGEKLTVIDRPFELSAAQCWSIVRNKQLDIIHEGKLLNFNVNSNGQTDIVYWAHGNLDNEGWCDNTNFISDGVPYNDAMLEVSLNLQVRKLSSVVVEDRSGNPTLALTMNDDVVIANFVDGHLVDRSLGTCVWEVPKEGDDSCSDNLFALLLHGLGELYEPKAEFSSGSSNSYVIHNPNATSKNDDNAVTSALVLQEKVVSDMMDCRLRSYLKDMVLYQSHVQNIFVALRKRKKQGNEYFQPVKTNVKDARGSNLEMVNLQTTLAFITIVQGRAVAESLANLELELCQIRGDLLRAKIADIIGNGNNLQLTDILGYGRLAMVRGSVVYMIRGRETEVRLRPPDLNSCTAEIPVMALLGNRSEPMWCDVHTKLLKKYPTELLCNKLLPVVVSRFKLY